MENKSSAIFLEVKIPHIHSLLDKVPKEHLTPELERDFWKLMTVELAYCIEVAQQVEDVEIVFHEMRTAEAHEGRQYIFEFVVFNRNMPEKNSYNFYGSNTSQWAYAGGIVIQTGELARVSANH